VATVVATRPETATTSTLTVQVPDWPGHRAGQHVDVRLTAPDGYTTQRSYSIASATDSSTVDLTVQGVPDGEVSSYLVGVAMTGDQFELRGPIGGYFVWEPSALDPVLLVAGGSGIVPLMAMVRTRAAAGSRAPFRLVYSVRDPDSAIYATELVRRVRDDRGLDVAYVYTRAAPPEHPYPPGRLSAARLAEAGWPAELTPLCYVCGPTGFVEAAADLLVAAGHPAERIRTERYG
jgi:ferredoxin-NADP reductase